MKKALSFILCFLLLLTVTPVRAASNTPSVIHMTVAFNENQISQDVKDVVIKDGGRIIAEANEIGIMEIEGKSTLLKTLQSSSSVLSVSPTITINLPKTNVFEFNDSMSIDTSKADLYNRYQWDIKRVTNNGASYEIQPGNHDVVVGIIDTGVSTNHAALKANLLGGRNYVPANFHNDATELGNPNDIEDRNGHGSHCAGAIAGNGRIMGIAPNVGFRSYRVFGATGGTNSVILAQAILGATNDGVDVISMSIGGFYLKGQAWWTDPSTGETTRLGNDVADYIAYQRAFKYALAHNVTVVVAAGNEALNCTTKSGVTDYLNAKYGADGYKFVGATFEAPGSMPGIITVSATGPDDSLASYSNYGSGFIDVAAPGGDNQRYPIGDWFTDMCLSAYKNGGYVWMDGTSMATPKVSAVAALIISKYGKIAPTKVSQILYRSTEDLGKIGTDPYFGCGIVNAYNAVK